MPKESAYHYEPLYKVVRRFRDAHRKRVIATGLTLAEAQAHCHDPETSSSTATSKAARALTRRAGPWFDGYDAQKVYKHGVGWVQEERLVRGPSPETRQRHRFAPTRPHGMCERAGHCLEHIQDPRVEACKAGR